MDSLLRLGPAILAFLFYHNGSTILNEIVNNAVSYQESNFFYLYNMTQCAFNNMDAFLKKIEDKDTKSDMKKLFLVTTSNLFDVLPYAEIEQYIQFT